MRATRRICSGEELYRKGLSVLPTDFFQSCESHLRVIFHRPLYIGVRSSQVRGLFLDAAFPQALKQNELIATIPLEAAQTSTKLAQHPYGLPHLRSVEPVRAAMLHEEFKAMAPQFLLGIQVSSLASHLPDLSLLTSEELLLAARGEMTRDIMPWIRMLDDEGFNEQFIFGMYGQTLDQWQRASYLEMTSMFHKNISHAHAALKLPFSIDLFRRMTRLIIARSELTPVPSHFTGSRWWRKVKRLGRMLSRQSVETPKELSVVPLLDMINHSNRPNCAVRVGPSSAIGGKPALTIYSVASIEPGQELCRHYNFALQRPNALFRYGFLPFDVIAVVDADPAAEHVFKNEHMLSEESPVKVEQRNQEMAEIARLEAIFKQARGRGKSGS